MSEHIDVVIVGAGLAGLTAGQRLANSGINVRVLEKARKPGGRMSTRNWKGVRADHGAQYFTARTPHFVRQVQIWLQQGLVTEWHPDLRIWDGKTLSSESGRTTRFVPSPDMDAIAREMAAPVDCAYQAKVESMTRVGSHWQLGMADGRQLQARVVLMTPPPRQTEALLADALPDMARRVAEVALEPCWSAMAVFDQPAAEFDAAFVNAGPLSWVCRNNSKPGRNHAESWVLHATPEWSHAQLEVSADHAAEQLLGAFHAIPECHQAAPRLLVGHRWLYARATNPTNQSCLVDRDAALVVAGDWCAGNRVEGAWLSGMAAASKIRGLMASAGSPVDA